MLPSAISKVMGPVGCGCILTSIGQEVLLNFVSAVLQHVGHVLSDLLHHTANRIKRHHTPVPQPYIILP